MNESCTERRVDGKAIPSGSFSQNLNHYSLFKVHVLNLKTNISMEALTDAHFSVASHNDSLIYIRHIHMDAFIIKRKETKTVISKDRLHERLVKNAVTTENQQQIANINYRKQFSTYNKRV